jgi:hypothetical protein
MHTFFQMKPVPLYLARSVKQIDVLWIMAANCVLLALDSSTCFNTGLLVYAYLDLYSILMAECSVAKDLDGSYEMEAAC